MQFVQAFSIILFLLACLSAEAADRDARLEAELDAVLGVGMAPVNEPGLQAILADLDEATTPAGTYVRARAYHALQLGLTQGKVSDAMQLLDELEPVAAVDPNTRAEVLNSRIEIQLHHQQSVHYLPLVQELRQLLPELTHSRIRYHSQHAIGRALKQTESYEEALQYLLAAHEELDASDDAHTPRRRQFLNLHIGRLQVRLRQFDRALDIISQTIADSYQYELYERLPELYLARGYINQQAGQDSLAAITDFNRASLPPAGQPVGRTQMLALNNLGAIQLHAGQYDAALEYLQQAVDIAETADGGFQQYVARFNIGYTYVLQGKHQEGIAQMAAALRNFEQRAPVSAQAEMYGYYAAALREADQHRDANDALQRQIELLEQTHEAERERVLSELQLQHEAQEQSLRIQLLEQESALREEQLQSQQRNQRWFTGLAILLLLGLIGAILAVRRVRRLNRMLQGANQELQEISRRDPLTQLYNRRALYEFTEQQSDLVVLLDVDNFKAINDQHGHERGDQVLTALAQRLQQTVRREDLVLRWGGEEFLLVLRQVTRPDIKETLAKVQAAISSEPLAGLHITASGGAVFMHQPQMTWQNVIHTADRLLYEAKHAGRARIHTDIGGDKKTWIFNPNS